VPVDSLRKRQAFEARRRAIDVLHVGVVWRGVGPVGWAPRAVRAAAGARTADLASRYRIRYRFLGKV